MLPTLAVILWAYGMYALLSFIFQRKGGQSRGRGRKLSGLTLVGAILGVGLILWCCYSPEKHDQRLKLAGFLGTVYAEGCRKGWIGGNIRRSKLPTRGPENSRPMPFCIRRPRPAR